MLCKHSRELAPFKWRQKRRPKWRQHPSYRLAVFLDASISCYYIQITYEQMLYKVR